MQFASILTPTLALGAPVLAVDPSPPPAETPPLLKLDPILFGLYGSNPLRFSFCLMPTFTLRDGDEFERRGVFFDLEPGTGGGKIGLGYGTFAEQEHRYWKLAWLRTWGDPWGTEPDREYVGVDGAITYLAVSFRVGLYRDVTPDVDDWLFSFGIGLQFN